MKKYGLIGQNLEFSYSKSIHEYLINHYNIDASYELLELCEIFPEIINKFDGMNITVPFKNDVLRFIYNRSDSVNVIESCNVIDSNKRAYNTDINGFEELIQELEIDMDKIKRIVILGNSNTAQMLKYLFRDKEVLICSRHQNPGVITYEQTDLLYGDILINTTILGQGKYASISPVDRDIISHFKYAIDVNYNPLRNQFISDAASLQLFNINGLRMLIGQAVRSFEIWNDIIVSDEVKAKLYHYVVKSETIGTIFIGMPLCGKSSLCREFIKKGLVCVDIDLEIEKTEGMTISEIFLKKGEDYFRDVERRIFLKFVNEKIDYIFTGGGIVKNLDLIDRLHQYDICHIDVPLLELENRFDDSKTRPLISNIQELRKIYNERLSKYKVFRTRRIGYEEINDYKWT